MTLEHLLNSDVRDIQISGIRRFYNYVSQVEDAISLTVGQPDFSTPQHVRTAAKAAIDAGHTVYTPNAGLMEVRQAVADYMVDKYDLAYDPDTEVLVTNGASEAIDISLRSVLDRGSEVVLPGPVYPGYEPIVRLCGAVPVYVDTAPTGFRLDAARLNEVLTDRTRLVILPYPSNPTGATLTDPDLDAIARVLRDRDLFVLSDEIYSELVYDGRHRSIATWPGMREKTIVINGLSKSHAMTGWRIGFTLAPRYITDQMVKVHQYNATCASSISQYAALEALRNGRDDAVPMRIEYNRRRDFVLQRLADMGLETVRPEGAFYVFPFIGSFGLRSFDFAMQLLQQARVAVVPGDAFSPLGEGYVRISYACSMEVLGEAMDRMERFVASLR